MSGKSDLPKEKDDFFRPVIYFAMLFITSIPTFILTESAKVLIQNNECSKDIEYCNFRTFNLRYYTYKGRTVQKGCDSQICIDYKRKHYRLNFNY